ncbi:MAG: membrane protein insertion efficiency factor YidD [Patescibacteria group bacterium]
MRLLIEMYSQYISTLTPSACVFKETCSQFGSQALKKHGLVNGALLTLQNLEECQKNGQQLMSLGIYRKHFLPSPKIPSTLPVFQRKEYLRLLQNVILISGLIPVVPISIWFHSTGLSLVASCGYLAFFGYALYMHKTQKLINPNFVVQVISLLPAFLVSMPSMLVATFAKSLSKQNQLELQIGLRNTKREGFVFAQIFVGLLLLFIEPISASILILSGYLTSLDLVGRSTGRLFNLYAFIALISAGVAFFFNPVFVLPFILLWWYSKKIGTKHDFRKNN